MFSTSGIPTPITFEFGDDVTSLDHSGWTALTSVLTGGNFTDSAGTLTLTGASDIPDGMYYYDGDIVTNNGVTITFNESVFIDCDDFDLQGTASWDGSEGGVAGAQGYFGGGDSAQEGIEHDKHGFLNLFNRFRRRSRSGVTSVPESNTSIEEFYITPDSSDNIDAQLPTSLYGNGGGQGMTTHVEDGAGDPAGGAATPGGAGLMVICNNLFADANSSIVTSGADSLEGGFVTYDTSFWYAGRSGFGWPGVVLVAYKNRTNPAPDLFSLVDSRTGAWPTVAGVTRPPISGWETDTPNQIRYHARLPANQTYADTQFGGGGDNDGSTFKFFRILKSGAATESIGTDIIEVPQIPSLVLAETLNTPRSPLGNISTIVGTVTAAGGDTAFSYATLEYRLKTQTQWSPIEYGITTESNFTVTSDGSIYEVKATAYNKAGIEGGSVIEEITTTVVNSDTGTSEGAQPSPPAEITLPAITGLELVNRQSNTPPDDVKFSSGNAEFKWDKTASTVVGDTVIVDPHFSTYKVVIKNNSDTVMRTEYTRDSFYTYTHDDNITDSCGRIVKIDVSAISTTAYETPVVQLVVNNPAPLAVTSVNLQASYTSVQADFTVDTSDIDFVGVDFYWQAGAPADVYATGVAKRFNGSSHLVFDGLSPGTQYTFGITSYDEFGVGASITQTSLTTPFVEGADVSGLGNWAYKTDPIDLAFINANMDNDALPSTKIVSLAAGKITAGTITAQVDVGTGAQLDGANGLVKTTAISGYNATMGSHSVPAESANALMLSVSNGSIYPFWVDAAGAAKFSGTVSLGSGSSGISNFSDAGGLATADDVDWSTEVTGGTKPEDNANATDLGTVVLNSNNLIANGGGFAKALDGRPAGVRTAYYANPTDSVSYHDESKGQILLSTTWGNNIGMAFPALRVEQGTKYIVRVKWREIQHLQAEYI